MFVSMQPKESTLIAMKEAVSVMFDLSYMNSFAKVSTTLSDQVTISLSSKLPAVVEYKIAEMGYIRYYMSGTMIRGTLIRGLKSP